MRAVDLKGKIEKLLPHLGERLNWAEVGELIDLVDEAKAWRDASGSFTEWLEGLGSKLNVKTGTLWRCVRAYRFFEGSLSVVLRNQGLAFPTAADFAARVSAENLELLEKLSRVLDAQKFEDLVRRLLDGSLGRAELRKLWGGYRGALEGRSARGRGSPTPKVNLADSNQRLLVLTGDVAACLVKQPSVLACPEEPRAVRVLQSMAIPDGGAVGGTVEFDLLALTHSEARGRMELHGIEVKLQPDGKAAEQLVRLHPYCDFLWLALPVEVELPRAFPSWVGILRCDHMALVPERCAGRGPAQGASAEATLRATVSQLA